MRKEECEYMNFVDILDDAMYSGTELTITTKKRGKMIGIPHSVDEFETDEERFGYVIKINEYMVDTVYIDEIREIITSPILKPEGFIQFTAKLVSGE